VIYKQQNRNNFKYNSQQLRIWNEVATIFLVAIVMLVVVRTGLGLLWGMVGLFGFVIVLIAAINIYKRLRGN
jgi:putative membrane protein